MNDLDQRIRTYDGSVWHEPDEDPRKLDRLGQKIARAILWVLGVCAAVCIAVAVWMLVG